MASGLSALVYLPPVSENLGGGGCLMPLGLSLPVCGMGITGSPGAVIRLMEIRVQRIICSKHSVHVR